MANYIVGIKFALSYFTLIFPIKINDDVNISDTKSIKAFLCTLPAIGLVLSSITVLIFLILEKIGLDWYGAILCALFYMISYGFLHTEGFIDTVDGLFAKHSSKDAYKVMKEPTVGAMGVLFGSAFVIVKVSAIAYLLLNSLLVEFLIIPLIGRYFALVLIKFNKVHERSSFLIIMKQHLTDRFFYYITIAIILFIITTSYISFIGAIILTTTLCYYPVSLSISCAICLKIFSLKLSFSNISCKNEPFMFPLSK
jgi:adenosylcobinamide-GDP ribazoletransferase